MNFNQILTMNQTVPNHEGAKAFRMTSASNLSSAGSIPSSWRSSPSMPARR